MPPQGRRLRQGTARTRPDRLRCDHGQGRCAIIVASSNTARASAAGRSAPAATPAKAAARRRRQADLPQSRRACRFGPRPCHSFNPDHHLRSPVLGVEPELVLVIELAHRLDPALLERAELRVLDLTGELAMVAFASDPELTEFLRRLDAYSTGPRRDERGTERSAPYEALFDAIVRPRPLEIGDVLSPALRRHLESLEHLGDAVKIDVQCWCPEDEAEARRRREDFLHAVSVAGGRLIAGDFRPRVGLSLLRVEVAAGAVTDLARTDRARSINLLPRPLLTQPQVLTTAPADLPVVLPPIPGSPLIAVIDSGVASAHPLISPAVDGVDAIGISDGGDGHGHGTFVASLALHGSLEAALDSRTPLRPAGRLLSIRVLNEDLLFPDELLWETTLLDALRRAADAGARVVNLSLGDPRRPYRPPRPTVLAAAIDDLARRLGLIVVISAGNYPPAARDCGAPQSGDPNRAWSDVHDQT